MPSYTIKDGIHERIVEFMSRCQKLCDGYMEKNFPTLEKYTLIIAGGAKYLHIQKEEWGGSANRPEKRHSAYAFIDLTNGNILKPANWKTPAKHARGNVFAEDFGMSCMGPYGPNYMGQEPYCKNLC